MWYILRVHKVIFICFFILVLVLVNYFRPPFFRVKTTCGVITKKITAGKGGLSSIMEYNVRGEIFKASLSEYNSIGDTFTVYYEELMPFVLRINKDIPCPDSFASPRTTN